MSRNRLLALIAALCAPFILASPAESTAAPTPVPDQIAGSVTYLTSTYHISTTDAIRRLQLQEQASQLEPQLADRFPNDYEGMWIDQEHGGYLRIGMVHPGLLRQATAQLSLVS